MIANNSGSSHHTEKDLWLQVLALAKEIQDCKSYLYPKTLESIYALIPQHFSLTLFIIS